MLGRKPSLLVALAVVGVSLTAGPAAAQECNWCDRLAVYIKTYAYEFKPEAKDKTAINVINVKSVEYMIFETRPTTREVMENSPQDSQIKGIEGVDHYYFVCEFHRNLELALAFAVGKDHYAKYTKPKTEGVKYQAEPVGSTGETTAWYRLVGEAEKPMTYVVEIDNGGHAKEYVDGDLVRDIRGTVDDEEGYKRMYTATFRVLAVDPASKDAPREVVAPTPIQKLEDEVDVRADGATVFRLGFSRTRRPSEDTNSPNLPATESYRTRRLQQHQFGLGSRWIVRVGEDPLRRVLPRDEQYNKVANKDAAGAKNLLAGALKEYLDLLLSEYKELDAQRAQMAGTSDDDWKRRNDLRRRMEVLSKEIELARIHGTELQNIVFCDINKSVPAVRVWKDYTDPRMPKLIGLSPFDGAFQKYEGQRTWDYLIPYLTVIGVILVSSALSLVGVKSAGG